MPSTLRLFISYAREDEKIADAVRAALTKALPTPLAFVDMDKYTIDVGADFAADTPHNPHNPHPPPTPHTPPPHHPPPHPPPPLPHPPPPKHPLPPAAPTPPTTPPPLPP